METYAAIPQLPVLIDMNKLNAISSIINSKAAKQFAQVTHGIVYTLCKCKYISALQR